MMAILAGPDFKDGTIEIEVAGAPRAEAPTGCPRFIGVAFRVQRAGTEKGGVLLMRPTNARCADQLRRNHATQYVSERPTIRGNACARKVLAFTSLMPTWKRVHGPR